MRAAPLPVSLAARKLYVYHLKKCGGTSMESWLAQHVEDTYAWQSEWLTSLRRGKGDGGLEDILADQALLRTSGIGAFFWSDVVHTHAPIRPYAPPGTFCMTTLREPVSRLASQIADLRRFTAEDHARVEPHRRECIEDVQKLRVLPFLEKHGNGAGKAFLDNYMVRALAAARMGELAQRVDEAAELLELATTSLEQDFDLVGLAEHDQETRNSLCAQFGWAPAPAIPRLNHTGSAIGLREEVDEAMPMLLRLTREDAKLYQRARQLFDTLCRPYADYDLAQFEAAGARTALRRLKGHWLGGRTAFSVRQPLVGYGFHGRDATGTPECAVWTGPGATTCLYVPVPPDQNISVLLWIRGYADETQRAGLRVRLDGREVTHRFEAESGYRDVLAVDANTRRDFVRLELDIDAPAACGIPGEADHDARLRGICFDRYGWIAA